jgi:hypothetical protein
MRLRDRTPARAAALGAALLLSCVPQVVRETGPLPSPAARWEPAVRVLVFGDFGQRTWGQRRVAAAMARAHRAAPFDLAIELGDNLYPCGPDPTRPGAGACRFGPDGATVEAGTPADDPLFRANEVPLEALRGPEGEPGLPIFLAVGNHDLGWDGGCGAPGLPRDEALRRRACLVVAHRTPEWWMPARHYAVDRGPIRLVVLDTNVVAGDYAGFTLDAEVAFLRDALRGCEERLCFVAAHHPPAAAVEHPPPGAAYHARMARLLAPARGRAVAFLAGHEHSLQHLVLDGLDVFVSGSTAHGGLVRFDLRYPAAATVRFASSAFGFGVLEASRDLWRFSFLDDAGRRIHCCEGEGRGPCRPVRCL